MTVLREGEAGLLRATAAALQLPWPFAPIAAYRRIADMLAARADGA